MTTKLFISGKNWRLSLAEVTSYLKAKQKSFKIKFFSRDFFAIDIEESLAETFIEDLGGTIKIGETKKSIPTQIFKESFLDKKEQAQTYISEAIGSSGLVNEMLSPANKVFFGVSVYCSEKTLRQFSWIIQRFIGSAVKAKLLEQGTKAKFMGFSKKRGLAQLSHIEVIKKNLVENKAEILVTIGKEETWIATTTGVHNPFEFQKRDVYKPNQRKIFAMPPRLAKILVNLSGCSPGKVLLDPFCGVGTVLQEALLMQAKVVGVDVNSWCVKAANENLKWLKKEYKLEDADFRVVQGDIGRLAQKTGQETIDCIVTEPDLGPALRQIPTGPYAIKIIQKLEPLFFDFVEQAHQVLKKCGQLVVVTPYIVTRSGKTVSMPIGEKLENLGFTIVRPFDKQIFSANTVEVETLVSLSSLIEVDERHKIGREIHIYKK